MIRMKETLRSMELGTYVKPAWFTVDSGTEPKKNSPPEFKQFEDAILDQKD